MADDEICLPFGVERWKRCIQSRSAINPKVVCDKPLTDKYLGDGAYRCPDGHFNAVESLISHSLGRLVRDVWVVWAKDQENPKPSHLLPWEEISWEDQGADIRIAETLLGIRDWRIGQTVGNQPGPKSFINEVERQLEKMKPEDRDRILRNWNEVNDSDIRDPNEPIIPSGFRAVATWEASQWSFEVTPEDDYPPGLCLLNMDGTAVMGFEERDVENARKFLTWLHPNGG